MTLRRPGRSDEQVTQSYIQGLLIDEATQGLSARQSAELDQMVDRSGFDPSERNAWALTAAVCELAFAAEQPNSRASVGRTEATRPVDAEHRSVDSAAVVAELPRDVESRLAALVRQASRDPATFQLRSQDRGNKVLQFNSGVRSETASRAEPPAEKKKVQTASAGLTPWLVAAAAVVLAVGSWFRPTGADADGPTQRSDQAAVAPAPSDLVSWAFTATEDPAASGATGRVSWSPAEQRGSMEIVGLAANDPSVEQYQLWIFDSARDQRYPVDGGVFNVVDGTSEIPIDAKVVVSDATLFAITVEAPGGVVVSGRERIVLTASVGA